MIGTTAVNSSFPAVSHTAPVELQFLMANWSNLTNHEILLNMTAAGVYVDVPQPNSIRFNNNWETGGSSPILDLTLFANNYVFVKYRHDSQGVLGPPKTDYLEAWDEKGVLKYSITYTYTSDVVFNFGAISVGHDSNNTQESFGFVRISTQGFTPLLTRSPATADVANYAFQWKFDGNLNDAVGLWPATYDFGSPSYESTLYQGPVPIVTLATTTWRAGYPQGISAANSYSQSNVSSVVSQYSWQVTTSNFSPFFSSLTASNPTLTGIIAGDYGFNLTIIDAESHSSSTIVHVGAVATDNNDIVINSTGIPPNSVTDYFLGPMQRWESSLSLYPLFDVLEGGSIALEKF